MKVDQVCRAKTRFALWKLPVLATTGKRNCRPLRFCFCNQEQSVCPSNDVFPISMNLGLVVCVSYFFPFVIFVLVCLLRPLSPDHYDGNMGIWTKPHEICRWWNIPKIGTCREIRASEIYIRRMRIIPQKRRKKNCKLCGCVDIVGVRYNASCRPLWVVECVTRLEGDDEIRSFELMNCLQTGRVFRSVQLP